MALEDFCWPMIKQFSMNGIDALHEQHAALPATKPEDVKRTDIPQPPSGRVGF